MSVATARPAWIFFALLVIGAIFIQPSRGSDTQNAKAHKRRYLLQQEGEVEDGGDGEEENSFAEESGSTGAPSETSQEDQEQAGEEQGDAPEMPAHFELKRGKPLQTARAGSSVGGRARVEHGRWAQVSEGSDRWIFVAKGECPNNVCAGTSADETLRQLLDIPGSAEDKDLYDAVLVSKNWNKLSDKGMRDQACKGHNKHELEFWCKGQAGLNGQLALELDSYEQDWRQKAITRQKAKFAMLEYSKQRKAHEEEHAMAIATITKAKELLTQKRQALQQEESKVKDMEGKVQEALKSSAEQLQAGEEALRTKELDEMVAWQQMQNKRQLVTKFRALNKADIAEMIRQQREDEKKSHPGK